MLISFSGRPGVGKSTISRLLAQRTGATHLRIDIVDQTLRDIGFPICRDESYRICYALAEDNLRLGRTIISDCVNDMDETREAWRSVAVRAGARFIDVEVVCSDAAEHRRRVETRISEVQGLVLPTWEQVLAHEPEPWRRERLIVDTATSAAEECASQIEAALAGLSPLSH
jgi:predicted kinase